MRHGIQSQAYGLWANRAHDAFSLRPPKKAALLFSEEFEKSRHREQQCLRISVVQVGPGQQVAQIISKPDCPGEEIRPRP